MPQSLPQLPQLCGSRSVLVQIPPQQVPVQQSLFLKQVPAPSPMHAHSKNPPWMQRPLQHWPSLPHCSPTKAQQRPSLHSEPGQQPPSATVHPTSPREMQHFPSSQVSSGQHSDEPVANEQSPPAERQQSDPPLGNGRQNVGCGWQHWSSAVQTSFAAVHATHCVSTQSWVLSQTVPQSTGCPQLLSTVPHRPLQVVLFGCGVQQVVLWQT